MPARRWRKISSRSASVAAGGSLTRDASRGRRSCAIRTGVSLYDPLMPQDERARGPRTAARRIGADIGGTFTDVAFVGADGGLETHKIASTPPDFGRAVAEVVATLHED